MSGKLLYSITDENPDLHKQLGCMNGFLQLFDRQHFLASRRTSGNNHKRLTAGQKTANQEGIEPNSAKQKAKEKNRKEAVKERERVSTESSRTSFSSSSCSSTFSSVDCNRTAQPEPSTSQNSIFSETPSEILNTKQPNSSWRLGRQSLDLRDVVKDSIYRETYGLSVKTTSKEEARGHVVKHIDSPRPSQLCKSVKHIDSPRFSYDGRESRGTPKSNTKLKELPRLSLDSRAGSIRSSDSQSRANHLLEDLQRANGNTNKILNTDHEPGSNKRPSGVVAKLMGLEAFPDSTSPNEDQIREIKSYPDKDFDSASISSRITDESKQSQVLRSPRIAPKDDASPRLKNVNSEMKQTPSSRFPIEPAPWKHLEGSQSSQKPSFMYPEVSMKSPNPSPSVYGEIEKRLKELEFRKSGKDLRALKQILEAMQKTRDRFEGEKEEHASDFVAQISNHNIDNSLDQSSILTPRQSQRSNNPISPTIKGTSPPNRSQSPIMIIKPAKLIDKPRNSGSSSTPTDGISGLRRLRTSESEESYKDTSDKQTAKDITPRINHLRDPCSQPLHSINKNTSARTRRTTQILTAPQHKMQENSTKSGRSLRTISPKSQQKKQGMDKQSRPTTLSSNMNRANRQSSKQSTESSSPSQKSKSNSPVWRQSDDQRSVTSSEIRNSSCQGDAMPVQSESNISLTSQDESEVTSTDHFNETNGIYQQKVQKDKNPAARLTEDKSIAELTTNNMEQPSPVSILDATFDREDSPSPVKKVSTAFKDDDIVNSDEAEWNPMELDHLLNNTRPNLSSEFDQKELENTMHLVHKLRPLDSFHEEAKVDDIASLCGNTNQEHRYIAEIMSASGLLHEDQDSRSTTIQIHPSGHLINPNLFFALERTKRRTELQKDDHNKEKVQRKLIFDTVDEILVHKLASDGSSELWISSNKMGPRIPSGKKLLKEICSEIDRMQLYNRSLEDEDGLMSILSDDMMHQFKNGADYIGEVPGLVLDIERLIFKDLIGEIVNGRPSGHCRQLFSN